MKRVLACILAITLLCGVLSSCAFSNAAVTTPSADGQETVSSAEVDRAAQADRLRRAFLAKADEVIVTDNAVTFTDGSGNGEITVKKDPQRTVSLYTSFTTLWYEAGGTVVGCIGGETASSLYTDYIGRDITADSSVTTVATSSMAKKWNVETILSLRPDLILCSAAMNGYSTIQPHAAAANIPVIVMEYQDFSDYLKWFKVCCHLTGYADLWESVALTALEEVVEVLMSCPTTDTPTVLAMFSGEDSLSANTSNTVLGGMITAMNATNIVDLWDNTTAAERLDINLETVYVADPDIIVIQCHAGTDAARELVARLYGDNPVWQSLTAVKEDRVYYLEKNLFHNKPNSRFAEAYATLAGYLYPAV